MNTKAAIFLLGFLLLTFPSNVFGQYSADSDIQDATLPKVFVLGEHEDLYEKAVPEYDQLLNVCGNDMRAAFEKWISMMVEMEAYAKQINYDINGVKAWIHVFWEPNGQVKHIGFHKKPNSRNVDDAELGAFFSSFINHYQFPLSSDSKYSHYTTVAFPVFYQRIDPKKEKN